MSPDQPMRDGPAQASRPPALPTLSVIMPSYNHARYLEGALRAHLDQSVSPLEILVIDDASTDDSCARVERLAQQHPPLRLIRLSRNAGVSTASNLGLTEARGDYVCFSAVDDLVLPGFAERSLELLARNPDAAFCFSDAAILVGDTGTTRYAPLFLSDTPCRLSPADMQYFLRRTCYHLPSHAILYRRQHVLDLGGLDPELRWIADWFMNYVLAFRYGACYIPEVLALFRVSPDSYSATGGRQADVQRQLVYRLVELLQMERFRDVAAAFRQSAVMFDLRVRVILWLLASPRHRGHLTPRLVWRLLARGSWSMVRPYAPVGLRRTAAAVVGLARRQRLGRLRASLSGAAPRPRRG